MWDVGCQVEGLRVFGFRFWGSGLMLLSFRISDLRSRVLGF